MHGKSPWPRPPQWVKRREMLIFLVNQRAYKRDPFNSQTLQKITLHSDNRPKYLLQYEGLRSCLVGVLKPAHPVLPVLHLHSFSSRCRSLRCHSWRRWTRRVCARDRRTRTYLFALWACAVTVVLTHTNRPASQPNAIAREYQKVFSAAAKNAHTARLGISSIATKTARLATSAKSKAGAVKNKVWLCWEHAVWILAMLRAVSPYVHTCTSQKSDAVKLIFHAQMRVYVGYTYNISCWSIMLQGFVTNR